MAGNRSSIGFRLMALTFAIRDFFVPRERVLEEVGIGPGFHVLDYGCGPGSYILPVARLVGESGRVYALDIDPLAIGRVKGIAARKRLSNPEAIQSDCQTGLPADSVDVVLLYDTLHALEDPSSVLSELHRVLKPAGILSVSDHHLGDEEIVSRLTVQGLFGLSRRGQRTYSFSKVLL